LSLVLSARFSGYLYNQLLWLMTGIREEEEVDTATSAVVDWFVGRVSRCLVAKRMSWYMGYPQLILLLDFVFQTVWKPP